MSESPVPTSTSATDLDLEAVRKRLDLIRWIAIADFILLIPLLMNLVGIVDSDAMIGIVGPIHGIGFLALAYLVLRGAGDEWWGWWFPIVVVITGGPPGSLYGEIRVRRELGLN